MAADMLAGRPGRLLAAVCLCLFCCGALVACGREGDGERPAAGPADRSAELADYPRLMTGTRDRARAMDVLLPLRQAIEAFAAVEGRYPRELEELVRHGYLPALPAVPGGGRLHYDPADGSVSLADS